MAQTPTFHPVYKALHRPLLWGKVERHILMLIVLVSASIWMLTGSLVGGVFACGAGYLGAWWLTRDDQQAFQIIVLALKDRTRWTQLAAPTYWDQGKRRGGVEV